MKKGDYQNLIKSFFIIIMLGLVAFLKFWNFIVPKDKIYFSGDFVELMPMRDYFYEQLRNGTLVLWDYHLGTGMPYLAADMGAFYPIDLIIGLFAVFYNIDRLHVLLVIHYWMGGIFTFLYTRQLGLFRTPAVVSSLCFMMGGFLLANPHHRNLIQTLIWLPLIFFFLDKALIRRQVIWAIFAGVALAFAFLAGHPHMFYFILLFLFFYYFFRIYLVARQKSIKAFIQESFFFFIMGIFFFGVSAIQLLPILYSGSEIYRETLDFGWKSVGSYPPINIISFLLPSLFKFTAEDLSDSLSYIGILPLIFGIWGCIHIKDLRAKFFGFVALFSLLFAFGAYTPFYKFIFDTFPGIRFFRIPSRINSLIVFSLAILSGMGVQLFLESLAGDEKIKSLTKTLKKIFYLSLGVGCLIYIIFFLLDFAPMDNRSLEDGWRLLTGHYTFFLFILGISYLIINGKNSGYSLQWLKVSIITLTILELLLVSMNFGPMLGGHMSHKDPALFTERSKIIINELMKDSDFYRISNTEGILHPYQMYQEGISFYDYESMPGYVGNLLPSEYLTIYFLIEKNPYLMDLLNIKYHIGKARPKVENLYGRNIKISKNMKFWELKFKSPVSISNLTLHSHLILSEYIRQGELIAKLHIYNKDNYLGGFPIRAGIETAEWSIDCPGKKFSHGKANVIESWGKPEEGYLGHSYGFPLDFKKSLEADKIIFEYCNNQGGLEIKKILINQMDSQKLLKDHFEIISPGIFKNNNYIPKVFTIGKAKIVPSKEGLLKELEDLNPMEYILLNHPQPGYSEPLVPSFSTHEAKIIHYSPQKVIIYLHTSENKFLVLCDTYNPYWQAKIDNKFQPILKVNGGLRGLYIPKGTHEVEFNFHFTPFYLGLILLCLTTLFILIFSFFKITKLNQFREKVFKLKKKQVSSND